MFTGLIEEVGVVRRLERREGGGRLSVRARGVLGGTHLGDSIAVSGACLTVVDLGKDGFVVDCMPETLLHTTLGQATSGASVNLERSLVAGGRLGGHLVLGHVDAVAEVLGVERRGIAWEVRVSLPEAVRGCVAPRGSIAIDGISLTVMRVDDLWFEVGIIPHTLEKTTLRSVKTGLQVNIEADVLARYVQQGLRTLYGQQSPNTGVGAGVTQQLLREQGFV
jgi:riboflavin synthase